MTKRKTKFFSLILSLILVLVSVTISISAKETSTEYITDETTQIQNNLISNEPTNELVEQESIVDVVATAATSTSEKITQIPEGIYAFENVHTDYYLSIENNSTVEGSYVVQTQYASSPIDSNNENAFFEITKHRSGETYIIRYKVNPNLTLKYDGERFVTEEISPNDSEVDITQTFYITINRSGVIIQQYGQSNYIASQEVSGSASPDPYLIQGGINNYSRWIPHSYVTHIEDGVYALQNVSTQLWMSIENDSCVKNSYLQQHSYTQSPAADFTRGGLFKITQIGDTGRYTIRLMTNNLLTLKPSNIKVVSNSIQPFDGDVPSGLIYDIVFDGTSFYIYNSYNEKFIAAPLRTSSFEEYEPNLTLTNQMEYNSRWNLYKYTGDGQSGVDIIVPDELNDTGAVVGNTYIFKPVVWSTTPGFNNSIISISSEGDYLTAGLNWDQARQQASVTIFNPGNMSVNVAIQYEYDGIVFVLNSNNFFYNCIPMEGAYYLRNCYSYKYACVSGPSMSEGAEIQQYDYLPADYFKWQVEHISGSGGYVRLKSLYSSKYLSVDPNDANDIIQCSSPSDNGLWRFELLDDFSVKMICKASESSGDVLAIPLLSAGNGAGLTQREYTDNNNSSDEWNIILTDYDTFMLGITETGHDHYTALSNIIPYLTTNNYCGVDFEVTNNITCSSVLNRMSQAEIFVSRSHGNGYDNYSFIKLNSVGTSSYLRSYNIYDFDNEEVLIDLSNCELILFIGCGTGYGNRSLPRAVVKAGATCGIGFQETIGCDSANTWTEYFFKYYNQGYSVDMAAELAINQFPTTNSIWSVVVIDIDDL